MSLNSTPEFSRFVGEVYDCVAEPARWNAVLSALTDHYGGIIATMSILDTNDNQARFAANFGPAHIVEPLVTTYSKQMPFYHVIPRMEIDVPISMETIFAWAGPNGRQKLYEGAFGEEWATPNKIEDAICLALLKQKNRVGTFVITTTTDRPRVTNQELEQFSLIAPHLRRAATIGDLFETQLSETEAYREALKSVATAIFIVAADMKLRFANVAAEQMLKSGKHVSAEADTLSFASPLVQTSIQRAIQVGERSEVALGSLGIGVPTAAVPLPAIAHVLPMSRRAERGGFDEKAVATIFVALPGSDILPAVEALAGLFGLTPAEKRVARLIADGKTRGEIALAHGVSDGTIKTQLDAIFDKTLAKNQRQLQDLIRQLAPPVNPGA